ncbi:serine/threonine protein kinase [Hyalangium versicolor]|uniref:serine/threonine protein kinase n=1 Tax=Hyalangium versicolor TaxID=2861190 RepID=UPI001CCF54E6|nr:serine/threonine-protein kinase [Hyalangium versicolor]
MGSKRSLREVDPLSLPPGMQLGPWRILAWTGRGAYGTLYRVHRIGHEEAGPFALKLAVSPEDDRFEREAWLLSRIQSPYVPGFHDQGVWKHPSGAFPYLVMDWIDGEPLYEWAARRNPSSAQCAGMLAHVARALQAAHAVGGLHRDVKGANVLVRPADGRVFLTDFGAGDYRGATTLTSKLLPPGTPAYRSPEAWGFLYLFRRHPTVHYPASACDDLFALGVMAYRLVTDEYPPSTHPQEYGAEVWREGGNGPQPPRALNPHVSPALDSLILRLLSVLPDGRFDGDAREAAEALVQASADSARAAHEPLFDWGLGHRLRLRSPEVVRRAAQEDASASQQPKPPASKKQFAAQAELTPLRVRPPGWTMELGGSLLALLLAGLSVALFHHDPDEPSRISDKQSREGEGVSVGDDAISRPVPMQAPTPTETTQKKLALPVPDEPLEGQRKPPCDRFGEMTIKGGCWFLLNARPPCKDDAYEWKGACYTAAYPPHRRPTSTPP